MDDNIPAEKKLTFKIYGKAKLMEKIVDDNNNYNSDKYLCFMQQSIGV